MIQWTCIQMEGFDFMYETFYYQDTKYNSSSIYYRTLQSFRHSWGIRVSILIYIFLLL